MSRTLRFPQSPQNASTDRICTVFKPFTKLQAKNDNLKELYNVRPEIINFRQ
jgi:hypothetical protein